jgi:methyltransferase-like protein
VEGNLMTDHKNNSNGFTQKEMLIMILDGQEKINERIDQLHEKVNSKVSRAELSGWVVAVASLAVLVQALM